MCYCDFLSLLSQLDFSLFLTTSEPETRVLWRGGNALDERREAESVAVALAGG